MRIARLLLPAVPLLLLACDRAPVAPEVEASPAFAATSEWYQDEIYLGEGGLFYAPCIDDYIDEIGTVYRKRHRVIQDDGVALVRWAIRPGDDYVARGTVTGDWHIVTAWHSNITTTTNVGSHYTWRLRWVVKNSTTGMVLDWPIRETLVVNANGEMTVYRYVEPCKVRHD